MTVLKKTDREELLADVLTEAFAPRFDAITKSCETLLQKYLAANHAVFVKLLADPDARKYLAVSSSTVPRRGTNGSSTKMYRPVYGIFYEEPGQGYHSAGDARVLTTDVIVPCAIGDFVVTDPRVVEAYSQAWADYSAAWNKMTALLGGYKTHEKFIEDFPEFEQHLPTPPQPVKLPAVIVKDVRRDLKRLGVPSK